MVLACHEFQSWIFDVQGSMFQSLKNLQRLLFCGGSSETVL